MVALRPTFAQLGSTALAVACVPPAPAWAGVPPAPRMTAVPPALSSSVCCMCSTTRNKLHVSHQLRLCICVDRDGGTRATDRDGGADVTARDGRTHKSQSCWHFCGSRHDTCRRRGWWDTCSSQKLRDTCNSLSWWHECSSQSWWHIRGRQRWRDTCSLMRLVGHMQQRELMGHMQQTEVVGHMHQTPAASAACVPSCLCVDVSHHPVCGTCPTHKLHKLRLLHVCHELGQFDVSCDFCLLHVSHQPRLLKMSCRQQLLPICHQLGCHICPAISVCCLSHTTSPPADYVPPSGTVACFRLTDTVALSRSLTDASTCVPLPTDGRKLQRQLRRGRLGDEGAGGSAELPVV